MVHDLDSESLEATPSAVQTFLLPRIFVVAEATATIGATDAPLQLLQLLAGVCLRQPVDAVTGARPETLEENPRAEP